MFDWHWWNEKENKLEQSLTHCHQVIWLGIKRKTGWLVFQVGRLSPQSGHWYKLVEGHWMEVDAKTSETSIRDSCAPFLLKWSQFVHTFDTMNKTMCCCQGNGQTRHWQLTLTEKILLNKSPESIVLQVMDTVCKQT